MTKKRWGKIKRINRRSKKGNSSRGLWFSIVFVCNQRNISLCEAVCMCVSLVCAECIETKRGSESERERREGNFWERERENSHRSRRTSVLNSLFPLRMGKKNKKQKGNDKRKSQLSSTFKGMENKKKYSG